MIHARRSVLSSVLFFITVAFGLVAAVPKHLAAAPAGQSMQVTIRLTASGIDVPEKVSAGITTFTVELTGGKYDAGIALWRLREGTTFEEVRALLAQDKLDAAFALMVLSGGFYGPVQPFIVDLQPGIHILVAGDPGRGPYRTFEVTPSTGAAMPEPNAAVLATLKDFDIVMPQAITPGQQTLKITNAGPSVHHVLFARLLPGKTAADLLNTDPNVPPAIEEALSGGSAELSTGVRQWLSTNFQPGRYVAVCFVHDPATGMPHAALGMLKEFTVGSAGPSQLPTTGEAPVPAALPETGRSASGLALSIAAVGCVGLGLLLRRRLV